MSIAQINEAFADTLHEHDIAEQQRRTREDAVTSRLLQYDHAGRPHGDTPEGFARWLLDQTAVIVP